MKKVIVHIINIFIVLIFFGFSLSSTLAAENEISRIADSPTLNNYLTKVMTPIPNSKYSGRVWTDKTVYPNNSNHSISIDNTKINFEDDFLEVFSALGTNLGIGEYEKTPIDLILTIDCSGSMATPIEGAIYDENLGRIPLRIDETVKALNQIIEFIMQDNPDNQIALILYASKATTALPLDHYSSLNEEDFLKVSIEDPSMELQTSKFDITVNAQGKEGAITKVITNQTHSSSGKISVGEETNFQTAYKEGMKNLIENTTNSVNVNRPKLINLTDGICNRINYGSWENSNDSLSVNTGDYKEAEAAIILGTLLTSSYNKAIVNSIYKNPLELITIGLDLYSITASEKSILDGLLNTSDYLVNNSTTSDPILEKVKEYYDKWLKGEKLEIKLQSIDMPSYTPTLNFNSFPSENSYKITLTDLQSNLSFIDHFKYVSSYNHSEVFSDIIDSFLYSEFSPIDFEQENSFKQNNTLTYTEPIGEYMEISSVKSIILFGKQYNLVEDPKSTKSEKNITTYIPINSNGSDEVIENRSYKDYLSFALSDIKVEIEKNEDFSENLIIHIPQAALPIFKTEVTVGTTYDLNGQKLIEAVDDNRNSAYSNPIRIIYGVSLSNNIKNSDGSINLDSISEEYKNNNQSDDSISFYVTKYNAQEHPIESTETIGEAFSYFVPSLDNSYYNSQNKNIVYQTLNEGIDSFELTNPLTEISKIINDKNYYIFKSYYSSEDKKAKKIQDVQTLTGNEIKNYLTETTDSTGKTVLALNKNSNHLGDLTAHTESKLSNTTGTATTFYSPYIDVEKEDSEVVTSLGNNGKLVLSIDNPTYSLDITKYQQLGNSIFTKNKLVVTSGATITYGLEINNSTLVDINNVTVKDTIPSGLIINKSSISDNGVYQDGTIIWTINVPAGKKIMLTYKVTVPEVESGYWGNLFTITYSNGNTITNDTSNTVESTLDTAYISIKKSQAVNSNSRTTIKQNVKAGDKLTYYFEVTNSGTKTATNIIVTDDIPGDFKIIQSSISDNGTYNNNKVTWILDSLEPSETKLLSFAVSIPALTNNNNWQNIGFVQHAEDNNPKPSNIVEVVKPDLNLSISKKQSTQNESSPTDKTISVGTGDVLTYYLYITNNSGYDAENIIVTDELPSGLTLITNSLSSNAQFLNNIITWTIDHIDPYQTYMVNFQAKIPSNTKFDVWLNSGTVSTGDSSNQNISNVVEANLKQEDEVPIPSVNNDPLEKNTLPNTEPSTNTNTVTTPSYTTNNSSSTVNNKVNPTTGLDPVTNLFMILIAIWSILLFIINCYRSFHQK